jgi:hypothetical protein
MATPLASTPGGRSGYEGAVLYAPYPEESSPAPSFASSALNNTSVTMDEGRRNALKERQAADKIRKTEKRAQRRSERERFVLTKRLNRVIGGLVPPRGGKKKRRGGDAAAEEEEEEDRAAMAAYRVDPNPNSATVTDLTDFVFPFDSNGVLFHIATNGRVREREHLADPGLRGALPSALPGGTITPCACASCIVTTSHLAPSLDRVSCAPCTCTLHRHHHHASPCTTITTTLHHASRRPRSTSTPTPPAAYWPP